jgi:hypothetical protein
VEAEDRRPQLQATKTKKGRARPLLIAAAVALLAIFAASALYVSRPSGAPAAAVDVFKALVKGIAGSGGRDADRSEMRDLGAALAQATTRLDRIEQQYGARLDKLGEGVDQTVSTRLPAISARLDALEKKAAQPVAPASQVAELAAKLDKLEKRAAVAAQPASEIADLAARLDRLEKRAAVPTAGWAAPLPPPAPKPSTVAARAQPPASSETILPGAPKRWLPDYSVEDVEGGVAVVDSRYGQLQAAPGDFIPGAGRVLRIERRGGGWVVVTSNGVIASAQAPY